MSEPMYLSGDDYALNGVEDEDDEVIIDEPDRMWEDDE
jgi:hypothetical protein